MPMQHLAGEQVSGRRKYLKIHHFIQEPDGCSLYYKSLKGFNDEQVECFVRSANSNNLRSTSRAIKDA